MNKLKKAIQIVLIFSIVISIILIISRFDNTKAWSSGSIITYVLLIVSSTLCLLMLVSKRDFLVLIGECISAFVMFPIMLLSAMHSPLGILKGVGNLSDWISFWGSYIGSMIGVVGAYLVMKAQILYDEKTREQSELESMLPYFNAEQIQNGYKVVFTSVRDNNVLRFVRVVSFDKEDKPVCSKDLGHKFSNKFFEIETGPHSVERFDIEAKLINGKKVFFSYGNGINGAHAYQKESEYIQYGGSEKGTVSRAKDFDKAFTSTKK